VRWHCNDLGSAGIHGIMRDPRSQADLHEAAERIRGMAIGRAGAPTGPAATADSRYIPCLPEADQPEDPAMLRTCICLLIAFASATVAAREIKLSNANSGSCPESMAAMAVGKDPARPVPRTVVPVRDSKAKPGMHGDANNVRQQSPRWHSFLPGMFR
jgi:hypothetical protein